jgi:hypothetical protein
MLKSGLLNPAILPLFARSWAKNPLGIANLINESA